MRNRAPPNARQQQEALLAQRQPIIKGAQAPGGQQFHYPQPPHQQPLLQQGVMLNNPQLQQLQPDQHFLDTSFERLSPQLPPVFEYDGLKYIDTARVEPRIGYSPEKTPPKTPETPHYRLKPFVVPGVTGPIPPALAAEMQAQAIANSPIPPGAAMEMTEISPGQVLILNKTPKLVTYIVSQILLCFPIKPSFTAGRAEAPRQLPAGEPGR